MKLKFLIVVSVIIFGIFLIYYFYIPNFDSYTTKKSIDELRLNRFKESFETRDYNTLNSLFNFDSLGVELSSIHNVENNKIQIFAKIINDNDYTINLLNFIPFSSRGYDVRENTIDRMIIDCDYKMSLNETKKLIILNKGEYINFEIASIVISQSKEIQVYFKAHVPEYAEDSIYWEVKGSDFLRIDVK